MSLTWNIPNKEGEITVAWGYHKTSRWWYEFCKVYKGWDCWRFQKKNDKPIRIEEASCFEEAKNVAQVHFFITSGGE